MAISLQTFAAWTNQFAARVQAAATALVDFSVGSINLATAEANSSVAVWFQWLLLIVLAKTRAATSDGPDLDTWNADYSFTRLGATFATGAVTFARFTPATQALIFPGAQVRTGDSTQTFTVTTDTTNAAWNTGLGGYVLPINTASISVPVMAVNLGSQGNVQSGAISQIITGISGVDTVTNAAAFTNGLDAESDDAFRARFQLWVNSRSLGVAAAIRAAVLGVQQNFICTIQENVDTLGAFKAANFIVTIDDGSGTPTVGEIAAAASAVEAVRGLAITYTVQGPTLTTANVSMAIATNSSVVHSTVVAQVVTAITNFIAALPVGGNLPISRLSQVAYDTNPAITNVFAVTINSGTADIVPGPAGVARPGTIVVT